MGCTTKAQVGLGNVDNTADADKQVSTAQQIAIDNAITTSGTNADDKITAHNTSATVHEDLFALKADIAPVASYTYNSNTEYVITAVDVDTNTFTCAGHGLANGDAIFPTINNDAVGVYPIAVYPGGIIYSKYLVVNATTNTFQLSLTSGGTAVDLTMNSTMDLTKWHFEKFTAEVTISGLPNLKRLKVLIKGKSLHPGTGAYILPNGIAFTADWIKANSSTYGYPDLYFTGDVMIDAELLIDSRKYLTIKSKALRVRSSTNTTNTLAIVDGALVNKNYVNMAITSISTSVFTMANGTVLEVYNA